MHLHRSRSKDKTHHTPGPSYMTSEQMSEYLNDLRHNRVARPTGARPPPSNFRSKVHVETDITAASAPPPVDPTPSPPPPELPARSASAMSHRRANSSPTNRNSMIGDVGRPLVKDPLRREVSRYSMISNGTADSTTSRPSSGLGYRESGHRWVEKQEAASIRHAMEELDLQEEAKIFNAARDEAAELVWKHQNPHAAYRNPDAPYRYTGHLEKGAHARSQSWDKSSLESLPRTSPRNSQRYSFAGLPTPAESPESEREEKPSQPPPAAPKTKIYDERERNRSGRKVSGESKAIDHTVSSKISGDYRRTSGPKVRRHTSGGLFKNPNDQIYEEPEEESATPKPEPPKTPVPVSAPISARRNPFSRLQSVKQNLERASGESLTNKRYDRFEIHKNPPTQSRNPEYTSNTPTPEKPKEGDENSPVAAAVKIKDGKEVRSDEIRAATSMRLKDRSSKLPTPSMVSDSPGRPIVSFQQDWKPKAIELKEEVSQRPGSRDSSPPKISPYVTSKAASAPVVPTINVPDSPDLKNSKSESVSSKPSSRAPIPTISVGAVSDSPRAGVQGNPRTSSKPPIPTINAPSIAINSAPPVPTINAPGSSAKSTGRPLPTPSKTSPGAFARSSTLSKPHITPTVVRTGALCSQCALPISGRIVSAAGHRFHPDCFRCHHCNEALECVAFYPEPDSKREERIDRIRRRQNGEHVEDIPGCSEADDGDESVRFYCHLDYHEFFSPRCKSCKTPIEGEVVVACGAEWHVGHFFCAQCGDPFDKDTPFVEKDGYAWCVDCHTNRYSTKCKKCRKPVTDTVVKALGAEWHVDCFCCTECGSNFDDGRYFLRGVSKEPVCVRCEERRLKA